MDTYAKTPVWGTPTTKDILDAARKMKEKCKEFEDRREERRAFFEMARKLGKAYAASDVFEEMKQYGDKQEDGSIMVDGIKYYECKYLANGAIVAVDFADLEKRWSSPLDASEPTG